MPVKTPLARHAARLGLTTGLLGLILLLLYLALWVDPDLARRSLAPSLPGIDSPDLPNWVLLAGFCLGLAPVLLMLYGLWQMRCFFRLYAGDDLFPARAGHHLRNFGIMLLVLIPVGILARICASLLFSAYGSAGAHRLEISVSISSSEILILLVGALVMMIGHILTAAHRLAEENRQFV